MIYGAWEGGASAFAIEAGSDTHQRGITAMGFAKCSTYPARLVACQR